MAEIKILDNGRWDLVTGDPALEDEHTDCYIFQLAARNEFSPMIRQRVKLLLLDTFSPDFWEEEEDETHSLAKIHMKRIKGKNGCTPLTLNLDGSNLLEGLLIGENDPLFETYLHFLVQLQEVTQDGFVIWLEERRIPEVGGWVLSSQGMRVCVDPMSPPRSGDQFLNTSSYLKRDGDLQKKIQKAKDNEIKNDADLDELWKSV